MGGILAMMLLLILLIILLLILASCIRIVPQAHAMVLERLCPLWTGW